MAVTEVEHESWFSRIMSAIGGVLFGLLIFVVAFPLLFWGEGRAVKRAIDLEAGSSAVTEVEADTLDASKDGQLVHVVGEASTTESLNDTTLGQTVQALRLRREVEMYAWEEESETSRKKNVGGSTTKRTTYTYKTDWASSPEDSSSFKEAGHDNPPMPATGQTQSAAKVTLGARTLSSALVEQIDAFKPIIPDAAAASKVTVAGVTGTVHQDYYYFGADPSSPTVGDVRIRLEKVDTPTTVSVVAAQRGETFESWETPNERLLEPRLEVGTHSSAEMFEQMTAENNMLTWIIRGAGFAMMLLGLMLVLRPLVVIADVIPLIGSMISGGAFLFSLAVALPLTLGTVAIGWIAYRPLLGIGLFVAAGAVLVGGVLLKRKMSAK